MEFLTGFAVFLFGLAVGSFANVVILRYGTGERIVNSRSHCFHCGCQLEWPDLMPVLSFFVLKGKCRHCHSKISIQYPLVELVFGALFLLTFLKWSRDFGSYEHLPVLFLWLFSIFLLVILSAYDFRHKILPDLFSFLFIFSGLALSVFFFWNGVENFVLALAPAFLIFFLWLFSRGRAMGFGDAKLMLGGGLFLGWPSALFALVFSFWAGAFYGITLLLIDRRISLKSEIPFGPFLVLGILIVFFFAKSFEQFFQILNF
ncbi:prepilin peptidase [Candidatus Giovannonibacteria bacterium]|nr:prepilin peptidase [Candidatus Giovannonibacteria bacterium]